MILHFACPTDVATTARRTAVCVLVFGVYQRAGAVNTSTVGNNFGGPSDMGVGVIMAIMWCSVVACVAVCVCGRRHWLRTRRWMCRDAECDGCLQTYTCCAPCCASDGFCCSDDDCSCCNGCDDCVSDVDEPEDAVGRGCGCLDDDTTSNTAELRRMGGHRGAAGAMVVDGVGPLSPVQQRDEVATLPAPSPARRPVSPSSSSSRYS